MQESVLGLVASEAVDEASQCKHGCGGLRQRGFHHCGKRRQEEHGVAALGSQEEQAV